MRTFDSRLPSVEDKSPESIDSTRGDKQELTFLSLYPIAS